MLWRPPWTAPFQKTTAVVKLSINFDRQFPIENVMQNTI